jgi:transposase
MREHSRDREVDMDKMPTPTAPIVVNGNSTFPPALETPDGDAISLAQSDVSYSQDWPAYNEAQTNEKLLFLQLLSELTAQVPKGSRTGAGRPSADLGEMIFACCLKIYLNFSSRRTESDLKMAEQLEYLGHTPHFNTILKYLNKPGLTPILKQLVEFSAMPVKQLEEHFAADSSGFSTSMFGRWCEVRVKRQERRLFRKAHVMVGVKTNVIASIEVTDGCVSDYEPFPVLLERVCKNMSVKEISADMGYSSRKVLGLVSEHGAIPFIPFKKNANNRAEGCAIWKAMYGYFHEHREEFMGHYHKRSNVESVFSMMKRKQGTNLKSRNMTGQTNEILCKALVHNICVLIQEIFESGITVDFQALAEDELMCKSLP